jgi:triacylglycerol esterase/lipase EstA (alpha/beta hydrolase family)
MAALLAGFPALGAGATTLSPAAMAQLRQDLARDPQLHAAGQYQRLPLAARSALLKMMGSSTYAIEPSFFAGLMAALKTPNGAPSGANVSCALTSAHPYPVVLVHGTAEDMEDNFGAISPILANNGYCVYALNYGGTPGALFQAVGSVPSSAVTIANFIQSVLASTGASKVDLVGHSQGGMQLEYVAKLEGQAPYIDKLVALDPSTHGTLLSGLVLLADLIPGANGLVGAICQGCVDQEVGSKALAPLDKPPIAQPGPKYTVIETTQDEVITPPSSAFINERGVTNEYIQQFCWFDSAEHINTPYDLVTIQLILNALDPATAQKPNCSLEYPYAP